MTNDWPELDDAIRRKEEERIRQLRELDAELFTDEVEGKLPRLSEMREVRSLVKSWKDQLLALITAWNQPVTDLLTKVADAIWKPYKGDHDWGLQAKVVRGAQLELLALCWEVHHRRMYISHWLGVELLLDDHGEPVEFKIECKEPGHFLACDPYIEDLKSALLEAYDLGPLRDETFRRERKPGLLFSEIAKLSQEEQ